MQKQKILLLFILVFLSFNFSHAQDTPVIDKTLTLQQAVDIAIKYNLQVRQTETQMQTSKVQWNQARDFLLPQISANGSQGTNFGRSVNSNNNTYINQQFSNGSYGLNGSLILFSGLQNYNSIRQTTYAYDASKMDWQQQKDNITLNVILAYLQILSSQDLLAISRSQADVDARQVERLEIQNKEGAITPSALSDLKGQLASDQVNIVSGINAVESAKINLFQLLNVSYKRDVELERIPLNAQVPEYPANPDSIYQTAVTLLPLIKSSDLRIKAYEKALSVARGVYYPTLSLNAGVQSSYSSAAFNNIPGNFFNDTSSSYVTIGNTDYNVINKQQNFSTTKTPFADQFKNNRGEYIALSLQIPILNYLRARNNVKQAKINLENQRAVSHNTRLQLQQMVEQAYQNMIAAYGQYKSYQDQVTAFAESFRAAEIKFNAGAITADLYLLAKNKLDAATTNLSAARYNYLFRTKILDYYQGRLTW